jgi:hypothetical protein
MWSWDKVQHLLAQVKACENQWYGSNLLHLHQFFVHIYLIYIIQRNICTKIQLPMLELVEKFRGLCRKNKFIIVWPRDSILNYI